MTGNQETRQSLAAELRVNFRRWLSDLDDDQLAALAENWENVMNDAALTRVDSWIIAGLTIASLRRAREEES